MTPKILHIPGLIVMLAALTALTPLSIDAYLPAMPAIASDLGVSIHDIELTVGLYLAGFALGQLFGGPYSDHFGRRAAIFTGLAIFLLATLWAMLTEHDHGFWLARALQGFGGGISAVNSMAIIRDRHSGRESAQAMSRITSIIMLAPLLAPIIGALILKFSHWRGIFVFLFVYGSILAVILFLRLPETGALRQGPPSNPLRNYLSVLRHRHALGYLCAVVAAYAGLFSFISASPGIYLGYYGISASVYPILFGANIITLLLCNRINIHLLHRYPPQRLLQMAQVVQLLAATILLLGYLLTPLPVWVLLILVMLFIGMQGFVVSNATAGASEYFPHTAATAAALIGACGFAAGSVGSVMTGVLGDGTPLPMVSIMFTGAASGLLFSRWLLPRKPNGAGAAG
jgi:drug resistance transporter, Bcr/CflA subfamily